MLRRSLILSMALGGLVATAPMGAAHAQTTTIKASIWVSPKHPSGDRGYGAFMKYVEEQSKGSIKFRYWSGGSLLGARDTLPGLINGIAHVSSMAMTYFPAEFPYAQLISNFAMLSDNPLAVTAAGTEFVVLHCQPCREEYTSKGLVFTVPYSTTPYSLISKKPIEKPEDLKGLKFRSAGSIWDRWTQYVGGAAIHTSAAEMFQALDRGGVDVAIFSPAGLKAYSLWDVAKYNVMLPIGTYAAMSAFTFNQGLWKSLTPEQRRIVLYGTAVGAVGTTGAYIDDDVEVLAEAKAHGVNIVEPSESLKAHHKVFVEEDLKKLVSSARDQYKIADAEQWIAKYREIVARWERRVEKLGNDRQKVIEAMQREIFDKVDLATYGM
jgi:TRAP-type C4-dicarboxylate transport system substrate-binding protein